MKGTSLQWPETSTCPHLLVGKLLQVESVCDIVFFVAMASPIMSVSRMKIFRSRDKVQATQQHSALILMLKAFVNVTLALPSHWWGMFSNIGRVLRALF